MEPLEPHIELFGYEDHGFWCLANLRIQNSNGKKRLFSIHGGIFFSPTLVSTEVTYLKIRPAFVKKCIQYLNFCQGWERKESVDYTELNDSGLIAYMHLEQEELYKLRPPLIRFSPLINQYNKIKKAEHFLVESKSELWCDATLIQISKSEVKRRNTALLLLLYKAVQEGENWTDSQMKEIPLDKFESFILTEGYLGSTTATELTEAEMLQNMTEILLGIQENKGKLITDGKPIDFNLLPDYFSSVRRFATINNWNQRQFFIETFSHWILFSWSTGA